MGVAHDPLGDAAHQRPPYPAAPPAAHRYQSGPYVLGQGDDFLGHPPVPQVGLRFGTVAGLGLLYLFVASAAVLFVPFMLYWNLMYPIL